MKAPMKFFQMFGGGGGGGGMGGYGQAVGILGTLGTDIWGMVAGSDLFGSKPKVAPVKPVKSGEAIGQALTSDIGAMGQISQLGDLYKSYMTQNMDQLFGGPGAYTNLISSGASAAQQELDLSKSFLAAQVPPQLQQQWLREGAFQNLMSGAPAGSGLAMYNQANITADKTMQLMGLGADLASQGTSAAQRWSSLASADVLNPGAFFVTPQQQIALDQWNNLNRQAYLQAKYNVQAMPDPQTVGDYGILSSRFGALAGMGGGGGAPAGGAPSGGTSGLNIGQLLSQLGVGGGSPYNVSTSPDYQYQDFGGVI